MTITLRSRPLALGLVVLAAFAGAPAFPTPAWSAPAAHTSSSSAAIRTDDVDATLRWYRDNLGFRVIADRTHVQGRSVVLERRGMLLEIAEAADASRADPRPVQVRDPETTAGTIAPVLSLLVEDVDAEVERLRARGVTIVAEPDDDLEGRFRTSWIGDHARHVVELREPLTGETGNVP